MISKNRLQNKIRDRLADLSHRLGRRQLTASTRLGGGRSLIGGIPYYDFSTNDYLGLLDDASAVSGSLGSSGSRLLSGTSPEVLRFESDFSDWMGTSRSLMFNSGYHANIGVISAVVGPGDWVIADRLAHASIWDGIRLSGVQWRRYPHNDMGALEARLSEVVDSDAAVLVITESVFSMDGDRAPLADIVGLCRRYGASLMVDESHSLGVLGPEGRGAAAAWGLQDEVDIWMSGLGKAWAGVGAVVTGGEDLIELLISTSRSFIFSTALPPISVNWAQSVLNRMASLDDQRARLTEMVTFLDGQSHIIPVMVGSVADSKTVSDQFKAAGIWAPVIKPPTVPKNGARLRLSLSAALPDDAIVQVRSVLRGRTI